jgi:parallel beta-helix repeat protein
MNVHRILVILLGSLTLTLAPVLLFTDSSNAPPLQELPTKEPSMDVFVYLPYVTKQAIVNRTTSGQITQDEIWRGNILITGDVTIPEGVTLTIEPGTTVRFTAQSDDQHGGGDDDQADYEFFPDDPPAIPANMVSLIVFGSLNAQGPTERPITFTSDSPSPFVSDWQSIAVESGGMATLENVIMEYNYWGLQLNTNASRAIVTDNTFRHIATCGVCTGPHPIAGPIVISDNEFSDCRHEAVSTFPSQNITVEHNLFFDNLVGVIAEGNTILIKNNTFRNNEQGIGVINAGNPTIIGNDITQNTFAGIWIWEGSSATVTGNNILDNAMNVGLGRSSHDMIAENNWWGTTDSSAIEALIHDGNDQSGLGIVDFQPYALEPFVLETPKLGQLEGASVG